MLVQGGIRDEKARAVPYLHMYVRGAAENAAHDELIEHASSTDTIPL
jgi:hypothetical protein